MARVTAQRAREIVQGWAEKHGFTQAETLNLALISRKVMNERDFPGRYAYLDRLYVVTGHEVFKLTPKERVEQERKKSSAGIDYELRRQIAEFLVAQWKKTGELPPEDFCLNLYGRNQNPIDDVIRSIRHSLEFQEFISSHDNTHVFDDDEGVESLLEQATLAHTEGLVALFEHLFRESPQTVESLAREPAIRRLAQLGTILTSGDPIETFEYFQKNQGRSLASPTSS